MSVIRSITPARPDMGNPIAVAEQLAQQRRDEALAAIAENLQASVTLATSALECSSDHSFRERLTNVLTNARDALAYARGGEPSKRAGEQKGSK